MDDPFVTDIWFQGPPETTGDENVPLPPSAAELTSIGEAMLYDSNGWEQSVHNLRYDLGADKNPEDMMTYRGPAQHQMECDPVMTGRYRNYHQILRAQNFQRQHQEKQVQLEHLRRQEQQVEIEKQRQAAIRQKAMFAQQQEEAQNQQAIFNKQHPQYSFLANTDTSTQGLGFSVPAASLARQNLDHQVVPGATRQTTLWTRTNSMITIATDTHVRQHQRGPGLFKQGVLADTGNGTSKGKSPVRVTQLLDQTITSSPTFHSSPAFTYRSPMRSSPLKANYVPGVQASDSTAMGRYNNALREYMPMEEEPVNSRSIDLGGYDFPVPRPTGMLRSGPEPDDSIIEVRRLPQLRTTSLKVAPNGAEPTPPLSAESDDDSPLSDCPEDEDDPVTNEGQRPLSPTLSDIIGSETSSEQDDEDDEDEDQDFDPRKRGTGLKVPAHREVRSFGMKKRRSSGRARR